MESVTTATLSLFKSQPRPAASRSAATITLTSILHLFFAGAGYNTVTHISAGVVSWIN